MDALRAVISVPVATGASVAGHTVYASVTVLEASGALQPSSVEIGPFFAPDADA